MKISFFTFFIVLFLITFLGNQIPELSKFFSKGSVIEIWIFNVTMRQVIFAAIVTFVSKTVKLHDKLSDVLEIRSRFEIKHIIIPMAKLLNLEISEENLKKLKIKKNRDDVMYGNFYKNAASDPAKTVIDRHLVTLALDQWFSFWIILKTMFFLLISGFILLFYGIFFYIVVGIVIEVLLLLLLKISYRMSIRLALIQVKLILDDDMRKNKIKNNLIALQS